jgi:hypothetical protein
MKIMFRFALVALAACFALHADNVAYINDDGGSLAYLTGYGHNVTYINDPVGLTLGDLAGYNAVIVASNIAFTQPANIGNVLEQFANAGGGVVLTEFDFQSYWALGGGIMTAGYSPFGIDPGYAFYVPGYLGTINDPSSPLLTGVNTANVYTEFQADMAPTAGATLVASWATGRPAIGYDTLADSKVVGLNLFPDQAYTSNSDTQLLVSNAISFSETGGAVVPEPTSIVLLGTMIAILGTRLRRKAAKG